MEPYRPMCVRQNMPRHAPLGGRGMGPGQLEGLQAMHSRTAGSRGTRVGSANTSAVMSIYTHAVMSVHSAQSANFVQTIGIPSPGLRSSVIPREPSRDRTCN